MDAVDNTWVIDAEAQLQQKKFRSKLISIGTSALAAWPPGNPNDLIISYVKGDKVTSLKFGTVLSLHRCAHWLSYKYPNKIFTIHETQRCYDILSLCLKKTNHVETMFNEQVDVCWDGFADHERDYLTFQMGRFTALKLMLEAEPLLFVCYDINDEFQVLPQHSFTLKQLLENDESYRIFKDFWESIPSFGQLETVLLKYFPRDIVHRICVLVYTLK